MDPRTIISSIVFRRYIAPVVIGSIVTWLVANNYSDFADAVCSLSAGLTVYVEACHGSV